jgi:hypothetical protein
VLTAKNETLAGVSRRSLIDATLRLPIVAVTFPLSRLLLNIDQVRDFNDLLDVPERATETNVVGQLR